MEDIAEPPAHQDRIDLLRIGDLAAVVCLGQSPAVPVTNPGGVPLVPVYQDILREGGFDLLKMLGWIVRDIPERLDNGQIDLMVLFHRTEMFAKFIRAPEHHAPGEQQLYGGRVNSHAELRGKGQGTEIVHASPLLLISSAPPICGRQIASIFTARYHFAGGFRSSAAPNRGALLSAPRYFPICDHIIPALAALWPRPPNDPGEELSTAPVVLDLLLSFPTLNVLASFPCLLHSHFAGEVCDEVIAADHWRPPSYREPGALQGETPV